MLCYEYQKATESALRFTHLKQWNETVDKNIASILSGGPLPDTSTNFFFILCLTVRTWKKTENTRPNDVISKPIKRNAEDNAENEDQITD
jgi:hypothetical protein